MSLTLVLAFHRVASAGSFTAAARASGVSQPTLSAQVKALELQMGAPLIDRRSRRIRLTPLGETLFRETVRLGAAIEAVEQVVTGARSESLGSLRVSADSAVHVLPVLARLKQTSSRFAFSLSIDNSAEVIARVLAEQADVGVTARAPEDERLSGTLIRKDRLVLVAASDDPLASHRSTTLAEIAGRELVMRERGSVTREQAEAGFLRARVRPGQVFDVATREAVREAVAAGFGIGLMFASEVGTDPRLATIALEDKGLEVAEHAVCRVEQRHRGPVARFFATALAFAEEEGWLAEG